MMKQSLLNKLSLFFRSLTFSIIMLSTAMLWSLLCILSMPFPLHRRFALVTTWTDGMVWCLKVICHIDYQLEGAENIPKDRNGVVLSKHQSAWETFFLPGRFRDPAIILKRELYWLPFFGWALPAVEPIAINRSDTSSAMEQVIKKGKKCLEQGRWILMFPEGTRIPPGKIGKYRLGGARLAVNAGYPVLPVAHNAGRFWPRRKFIKKPGTVRVVIGPLIETKGRTPEDVMEQVKDWIEGTMVRIDSA
jgi:1-acyl-sn-glycerol-3-phosphate acyltransferase